MTPAGVLFLLRLLSAILLLSFLAAVAWLIYRDMNATTALISDEQRHFGTLTVLATNGAVPDAGAQFPLLPVTSIGRTTTNTLVVDDEYASGEHALITLRGKRWWLEDLGSRNGTLLNDFALEEAAVITAGDVITIGNTALRIDF